MLRSNYCGFGSGLVACIFTVMDDSQFISSKLTMLFWRLISGGANRPKQVGQTAKLFVTLGILGMVLASTFHHHNWLMIQINHEAKQLRIDFDYQLWQIVFAESNVLSVRRGAGLILIQHGVDVTNLADVWKRMPAASAEAKVWALRQESNGQYKSSARWYELIGLVDADLGDPWYFAGEMYMEADDFSSAMNAYEVALKRQESDQIGRGDIILRLGDVSRLLGDMPSASMLYSDAIEAGDFRAKSVAEAYFKRAGVYRKEHLFSQALQDYRLVLQQQPRNYWAHIHAGWLVWQVEGNWQEAVALLQEAIELEPDMRWGYRTLADVYVATNEIDLAVELYEQTVALYPQDEHAIAQLSRLRADE